MLLPLALAALAFLQGLSPTLPARPGVWITREEILALPRSGAAWKGVLAEAREASSTPIVLRDQDGQGSTRWLAETYRRIALGEDDLAPVRLALHGAVGTEVGGRTLALGREAQALVIIADLVDMHGEPGWDAWLRGLLSRELDGRTLRSTHEDRPNNWGTHAGAARVLIAAYLGDEVELARCARVFKGWLGDRVSYSGFRFGDLSWQVDRTRPVAVLPVGARLLGLPASGILPEEQRRCGEPEPFPSSCLEWREAHPGSSGWCQSNYAWEALQGALVQALVLRRRGYDAWSWESSALLRAAAWLTYSNAQPPEAEVNGSDDRGAAWVLNRVYPRLMLVELSPAPPGKGVGFLDWTAQCEGWAVR